MSDTTNFYEFSVRWNELAKKTGASVGQVVRKVSTDLWTEITRRTPVRHGYARANWHMTVGAPSEEIDPVPDPKFEGVIPRPPVPDLEIDGKQDVFIANNLPYIRPLEDGHSQQAAPGAMVKGSIEAIKGRAEAFLNR